MCIRLTTAICTSCLKLVPAAPGYCVLCGQPLRDEYLEIAPHPEPQKVAA